MKVLVTGGAGYIGSVTSHRLLAHGAEVVALDNLAQGHRAALPATIPFEQVDVTDREAVLAVMRKHQPDAVLHFAALTIAPESVRQPANYWRVNTVGVLGLLDAMLDVGCAMIVFSSTAAVYGSPEIIPVREDAPLSPINPYGASKLAAERAIASYAEAYGLAYAALRYFNVAGAMQEIGEDHTPETHLIPNVLDAAMGRRDGLSLYGTDFPTPDGTAIRDYVHVVDLAEAHILALDLLHANGRSLGAINLGTREGASVLQVVQAVEQVTGLAVPVSFAERRPGDPAILIADGSKAASLLGWQAQHSTLEEMVDSAWQWRRRYPHGYRSG